jgi:hypothetical protein
VRIAIASGALLGIALLTPVGIGIAWAADEIKAGKWEFTAITQSSGLQGPGGMSLPSRIPRASGTMPPSVHTTCITDPDKALPEDPGKNCKIEKMERNGGSISWVKVCTPTGSAPVRSEGSASFNGDRMTASMTTHVPGRGGVFVDTSTQITGQWLGPCKK